MSKAAFLLWTVSVNGHFLLSPWEVFSLLIIYIEFRVLIDNSHLALCVPSLSRRSLPLRELPSFSCLFFKKLLKMFLVFVFFLKWTCLYQFSPKVNRKKEHNLILVLVNISRYVCCSFTVIWQIQVMWLSSYYILNHSVSRPREMLKLVKPQGNNSSCPKMNSKFYRTLRYILDSTQLLYVEG